MTSRHHALGWRILPCVKGLRKWRNTLPSSLGIEKVKAKGPTILKLLVATLFGLMLSTPAFAEVEQCRFIQAKAEREACYTRQEAALAAKRKPEPRADTGTIESLQQMRREDAEVYRSLHSICRGC